MKKNLESNELISKEKLLNLLEGENLEKNKDSEDVVFLWTKCIDPN